MHCMAKCSPRLLALSSFGIVHFSTKVYRQPKIRLICYFTQQRPSRNTLKTTYPSDFCKSCRRVCFVPISCTDCLIGVGNTSGTPAVVFMVVFLTSAKQFSEPCEPC